MRKVTEQKPLPGQKVRVLNLSNVPEYCAGTGKQLPFRGMVVVKDGKKYLDFASVR